MIIAAPTANKKAKTKLSLETGKIIMVISFKLQSTTRTSLRCCGGKEINHRTVLIILGCLPPVQITRSCLLPVATTQIGLPAVAATQIGSLLILIAPSCLPILVPIFQRVARRRWDGTMSSRSTISSPIPPSRHFGKIQNQSLRRNTYRETLAEWLHL